MKLRSLWPARALIGSLAVIVFVLVGVVVAQGAASAERAATLRHQLVAERLFDGMERELTDFLDDEEMRPFIDYRPGDGLVTEPPDFVVGYFQTDPEGVTTNPHSIAEAERERVDTVTGSVAGWGAEAVQAPRTRTVKVPVDVPTAKPTTKQRKKSLPGDLFASSGPSTKALPSQKVQMPVQFEEEDLPLENQLNNAWMPRSSRGSTVQKVSPDQLNSYVQQKGQSADSNANAPMTAGNEPPVQQEQQDQQEQQATVAPPFDANDIAEPRTERVWVPVEVPLPDGPTEVVDVVVHPFVVEQPDADTLVLHRSVKLGRRSWVQGLVVDVPALHAHLEETALLGSELGDYLTLVWEADASSNRADYAFSYAFGAPFESFAATVLLKELPGGASEAAERAVPFLAALMLLVALFGLFAVYRMIAVTLLFSQQRADFVSAVTHELKSPLTSIRMYSEMLESGMVPGPERQGEYFTTIRLESERLGRLVDDVLAFSRIERGLAVAEGETGRVGDVVDDVVRLLQPQAEANGAELRVVMSDEVRAATIDRDALSHVLTNLVDNAVKFSADADERVVELRAESVDGRIVVVVRDHGPGVPSKLLGRIFEPFFRGERELTRKTKGTGIGLALVSSMVERLDGAIDARNHPEGGFEVTVALPG